MILGLGGPTGGGGTTGGGAPVTQENMLSGTINGSNAVFTLNQIPTHGIAIFKNGMLQDPGSTNDYVWDGNVTITFDAGNIPQPGDVVAAIGY
jgi:hypothetical protein